MLDNIKGCTEIMSRLATDWTDAVCLASPPCARNYKGAVCAEGGQVHKLSENFRTCLLLRKGARKTAEILSELMHSCANGRINTSRGKSSNFGKNPGLAYLCRKTMQTQHPVNVLHGEFRCSGSAMHQAGLPTLVHFLLDRPCRRSSCQ